MPDLEGPTSLPAPEPIPTTTYGALAEGEMYHLAPVAARDAIARSGLDFSSGSALGAASSGLPGRGNYFWQTYAGVVRYQQFWAGRSFDLYRVNLQGIHLQADPLDVPGAHFTKSPIPRARLLRVLLSARS